MDLVTVAKRQEVTADPKCHTFSDSWDRDLSNGTLLAGGYKGMTLRPSDRRQGRRSDLSALRVI